MQLIGYLEKHQFEIIDYSRRSKAGKTIASGTCEVNLRNRRWQFSNPTAPMVALQMWAITSRKA
jgi:hypothetical protein